MFKINLSKKNELYFVKTPTIIQMEIVECGAVALGIVLAYFGKRLPLEELRSDVGVSRNGCNGGKMYSAAQKHDLSANAFKLEDSEDLKFEKMPLILHWNMNHFIVLEGFSADGEKVYINDPASGRRCISCKELDEAFTGIVFEFTPGENFKKRGGTDSVWHIASKYILFPKDAFSYLSLTGIMIIVLSMTSPVMSKVFVDYIMRAGNKNWLIGLLAMMICLTLFQVLVNYCQQYFLNKWELQLAAINTGKFFWKMLKLPMAFFNQRYAGEIITRVNINSQFASLFAGQMVDIILNFFSAIIYLAVILIIDWQLSLISVVSVILDIIFIKYLSERNKNLSLSLQTTMAKYSASLTSSIKMIETVKAEGEEGDVFQRVIGYMAKYINAEIGNERINAYLQTIPQVVQAVISAAVIVIGAWRVMFQTMTLGNFMAFQILAGLFSNAVFTVSGFIMTLQQITANLNRIDDVMTYPENLLDVDHAQAVMQPEFNGELQLKNITFGYDRSEPPLIDGLNAKVLPGEAIAFVGPSGSGKSTVAKTATGLYRVWDGEILYDDKPLHLWRRSQLAQSIGYVDQEQNFFSGTIRENITMFDSTISLDKIVESARLACIHDDIMETMGGYEGMLIEGAANISGGQRQRLEIARALCREVRLLILDEATSALDPIIEDTVLKNLRKIGCSAIIVAHRLSAIIDCDRIYVLKQGQIVQQGTHNELAAVEGEYKRLVLAE